MRDRLRRLEQNFDLKLSTHSAVRPQPAQPTVNAKETEMKTAFFVAHRLRL